MKFKKQGFTLIELLVTVVVIGILAGLGVPAFNDLINSNRMVSFTNELVASLQMARSSAVTRGSRVTLCQSSDRQSCTNTIRWEDGWIIFPDDNGNDVVDAGETVLRVHNGSPGGGMTVRFVPTAGAVGNISFISSGFSQALSGAMQSGLFRICDSRGLTTLPNGLSDARGVELSAGGRIRSTRNRQVIAQCP
ncbi:MAG: GspH/FimT family pseudopilin [Gammaproteobacteria bacterium]|nr:GspH/FimT family pseudopilin [Gammaproteobacteria bacterium]